MNVTIYSGIVRMLRNAIHKAKYIPKIETAVEPSQSEATAKHRNIGLHTTGLHTHYSEGAACTI